MKKVKNILKNYTLLYAEDDKPLQKTTLEYLQKYFKTVYTADDGKETLHHYKTMRPDILFLDIDMPYIDGLSVAQTIRSENKNIPIVMLTAYVDTDKLLKATELNLCKYLVKPFDYTAFKTTLRKLSEYFNSPSSQYIPLKENYLWDETKKELYYNQAIITLTQKEKSLLSLLIQKQNTCVTFIDIQAHVWEDDFDAEVSIQSVKLQVTLLRKKLPKESIKNVYGKGYILDI
ncbi:response regulator transcription factor [Sulfurimonas sp.]